MDKQKLIKIKKYIESGEFEQNYKNSSFDDILNKNINELFTDVLKISNTTMTANKEFYRLDKMSFFSEIKRELYNERKKFKKQMLEAEQAKVNATDKDEKRKYEFLEAKFNSMQLGLKILLNGGYGQVANSQFLYYMVENAEAITLSGQLVNKWTTKYINDFLNKLFSTKDFNYWVYGDTDQSYFTIKPFVDTIHEMDGEKLVDTVDRFCEEVISPKIKERCQELCDYLNCYEQRMFWEREVISNRGIFVGKKKYVMSVLDSEGTRYKDEPKFKIIGMESVKSSTPEWARGLLKECYKIALKYDEEALQDKVVSIRSEFDKMSVNDIAMPKGINGIEKYTTSSGYAKGTPKHVKGAIIHNRLLKQMNITRIQPIESGSKIKYVELKMPNPTGEEVIAFDTYFPKEFDLEKYVNRDMMYEKSFLQPLRIFLDAIGWSDEKKIDLFSF